MARKQQKARNYVCTLWDPALRYEELPDKVSYLIYQVEEAPKTGKHHLQLYAQMTCPMSLGSMKKIFGEGHYESRQGTHEEAAAYCSKEETRVEGPWELGIPVTQGSNKRKKIEEARRSPERIKLEDPDLFRRVQMYDSRKRFKDCFEFQYALREWQTLLEAMISGSPDDRTIIWVYGPNGNEGKSTYAKKLLSEGWFYTPGGKAENIKYQYVMDGERHVVFNFPRCHSDYINYGVIEELKDGIVDNTKYVADQYHRIKDIHVVVMSNVLPDYGKISEDRVKVIYA